MREVPESCGERASARFELAGKSSVNSPAPVLGIGSSKAILEGTDMHHAKVIMMRTLTFALLAAASAGCSSVPAGAAAPAAEIVLEKNAVRLEGWFTARGEWMVTPTSGDFDSYSPLDKPFNQRCVSVVNATGSDRNDFAALDGKRVVVTGFVMDYDDLPIGPSTADRLTQKRYYKDEVVFDFCLRRTVFVANSVRLSDHDN